MILLTIVRETKIFSLKLPSISYSGVRQPCDIEIKPYCIVLTQIDKKGKTNKILLSETQYDELREEINKIEDSRWVG